MKTLAVLSVSELESSSVAATLAELEVLWDEDFDDMPNTLCNDLSDDLPKVLGVKLDADAFFSCLHLSVQHSEMS